MKEFSFKRPFVQNCMANGFWFGGFCVDPVFSFRFPVESDILALIYSLEGNDLKLQKKILPFDERPDDGGMCHDDGDDELFVAGFNAGGLLG